MNKYFVLLILLALSQSICAQFTVGFKAGLTYSKLNGPSEMDQGMDLETKKLSSGFHVGATFNYKITDLFGLRSGLVFNQKGGNYTYNGPSHFFFRNEPPRENTWINGTREIEYKMTNAFIDIPLTAYAKVGKFEIHAGFYTSILAAGSAGGEFKFTGVSSKTGNPVEQISSTLDYNFYTNTAKGASGMTNTYVVDGEQVLSPSIHGAYFEQEVKDGSFLRTFDFGLSGALNYFVNDGFYIGLDLQYGLTDLSNNKMDISLKELNSDLTRPLLLDKDTNIALNVSLGFSF